MKPEPFPVLAEGPLSRGRVAEVAEADDPEPWHGAVEPWYFRLLAGYAWAVVGLGLAVAAASLVADLAAIASAAIGRREWPSPAEVAVAVAWTAGGMIAAGLAGAPVLLAVDVARRLRSIDEKIGRG